LLIGACPLGEPRHPFDPKPEGVPVNENNHPEGEEGVFDQKPRERSVGERDGWTGQTGGEGAGSVDVVIDLDREAIGGKSEPKIELHIHVGERGDIEILRHAKFESVRSERLGPEQKRLHFVKGIGDLRDRRNRLIGGAPNEVERNRIKPIT